MRLAGTAVFLLSAALCGGCVTKGVDTASGSPEVTIPSFRPEQIKPEIVNAMLNTGLRIKSDTQYAIAFEKREENAAFGLLLGTGYGPPVYRVTFAIAEVPGGTRIVADSAWIQNAGTGFEKNNGIAPDFPNTRLQAMLDDVALKAAPRAAEALPPPSARRGR